MDNTPININLSGDQPTQGILFRTGKAPDVQLPGKVVISGTIAAPADWYESKKSNGFQFTKSDMHIIYDLDAMTIELITEEHYQDKGVKITGRLETATELKKFGINGNKQYSAKDLAQFLKMNRIYFPDRDQCMRIVSTLNQLKLRVEKEIEDGNDFRGNKQARFEQTVKSDLDLDFTLSMPIFKGFGDYVFKVEILFDVTDNGATYWLESVDMKEIHDRESKNIIQSQLERMETLTIITK